MDTESLRGVREGPVGWRIVVVAVVSLVVAVAVTALAVALAPPRPPGSLLVGAPWQWTGAAGGTAEAPLVVPEPSRYTVQFRSDLTFLATTDCASVSGTYVRVLAGRTGLPSTGLRLHLDAYSPEACGPGSLSDVFLQGLSSATRYQMADSELTILRTDQGTMTFEVGGPAPSASGAG